MIYTKIILHIPEVVMKQKTKKIIAAILAIIIGGSIVVGSISVLIFELVN